MRHVRHAIQLHFERHRNLLLHFFGGMPRPLADDLRVGVSDIGIGFDREVMKRDDAPDEHNQRHAQHQDALTKRKIDEAANHSLASAIAVENSSALTTISSPVFTAPSCNSCNPSEVAPELRTSILRN